MPARSPPTPHQRPLRGIALKVASTLVFTAMVACIKTVAERIPTGEIVFFRSALALVPIVAFLLWRGEVHLAFRTERPWGHVRRGLCGVASMALWFMAVALVPLPEALAFGYASPLITVALAALLLGEHVSTLRWAAVLAGLLGILLILAPKLGGLDRAILGGREAAGVAAALLSACFVSLAMVQLRRLTETETTPVIVVAFSLLAIGFALLTLPFGWVRPGAADLALLVSTGLLGGVGQVLMTESYRHAEASTIASFDYAGMIWGLMVAWALFGEVPDAFVACGMAVVLAAGLAVIWRERRRGA